MWHFITNVFEIIIVLVVAFLTSLVVTAAFGETPVKASDVATIFSAILALIALPFIYFQLKEQKSGTEIQFSLMYMDYITKQWTAARFCAPEQKKYHIANLINAYDLCARYLNAGVLRKAIQDEMVDFWLMGFSKIEKTPAYKAVYEEYKDDFKSAKALIDNKRAQYDAILNPPSAQ